MKQLIATFAIVFTLTGISYAAVDSTRTLPANTVQPTSCLIEIDRQEGAGWELVELIDVGSVDLLQDYTLTVSVEPNVAYMMRATIDALPPCVSGPFVELRATGVCVR